MTRIALLLLAAAAPASSPLPLAELPPQVLAKGSCAMFLWERSSQHRVVMAIAEPATIRVNAGSVQTLAQAGGDGAPVLGFRPHAVYGDDRLRVELSLAITADDAGGAIIRDGAITVSMAGGDAVVSPVAGLVGCGS